MEIQVRKVLEAEHGWRGGHEEGSCRNQGGAKLKGLSASTRHGIH